MLDFRWLQNILPRLVSFFPYYLNPQYSLPPAQAFFEVTYRCNLRCDMCHYLEIIEDTEKNRKYKNELSTEQVKRAIAALPRFTLITFTGGEAFMKTDFMDILEFAAQRHKVHIITNGTPLTEKVVEKILHLRLKSVFGSGLFSLGVSMAGGEALHDQITAIPGSFRKTTQGLERLLKARNEKRARFPLVYLTCVMNRANVLDLVPLYDYANDLGVTFANFAVNNPATYWRVQNYDQEDHLQADPAPVREIEPWILKEQLARLVEKSKTHKTRLRFSPIYITPEEIVRYYSNESHYLNYRCLIPWAKMTYSAYGDVFSCPHVRLGHFEDEVPPWKSGKAQRFRERLKEEHIFPGCLGCCHSEYIGPQGRALEPIRIRAKLPAAEEKTPLGLAPQSNSQQISPNESAVDSCSRL